MKKLFLMFAAVAAITLVGCKTETKPAEQAEVVEETAEPELTVQSLTDQLMAAADAPAFKAILDGIKAKAAEFLTAGDNEKYFNIINIVKNVLDSKKADIAAKFADLNVDQLVTDYATVPDNMKDAFTEYATKAAVAAAGEAVADKAGEAVDAAKEGVADAADAAAEKVDNAANAVKDAAGNAVDAAKDKAAEGVQNAADKVKDAIKK